MLLESYVKVIDVLGLFFDVLSMGFYTNRHWQTSGRLVQELDVCTVHPYRHDQVNYECIGSSLSGVCDLLLQKSSTQAGKVLVLFLCIEFHSNMIASNIDFGYLILMDLQKVWHIHSYYTSISEGKV